MWIWSVIEEGSGRGELKEQSHDETVGQECQGKSDLYTFKTNASRPEIGRSLSQARFLGIENEAKR
jgi:hypothetical protein